MWINGDRPLGFDNLTETFDASASSAGNWTVDFGDGSIVVEPGPNEQAVEGTISAPDDVVGAVEIRQDNDQLRIEAPYRGLGRAPVDCSTSH